MLDIREGSSEYKNSDSAAGMESSGEFHSHDEVPRPQPKLIIPNLEPEPNYLAIFAVALVATFLVAGILIYVLRVTKESSLKTKQAQAQDLQTQLSNPTLKNLDDQMQSIQKGISTFNGVLYGMTLWSKILPGMAQVTPKNVKLISFSLDDKKVIKLTGETDNYQSIAKFMRSLEDSKKFSGVTLISSSLSGTAAKINFSLSLGAIGSAFKEASDVQPK